MYGVLALLVFKIQTVYATLAPTHLLVARVGPCFDIPQTIVTVSEMSTKRYQHEFTINGGFNITEDIENGWYLKMTMQKCQDIRNVDTCDYFKSYTTTAGGCGEALPEETERYDAFFQHTQPRLSCPIKAGEYNIVEYPLSLAYNRLEVAEAKISTSIFGYTVRLEGYSDDVKVLCVEAFLRLLYQRDRDWGKVNTEETTHSDNKDMSTQRTEIKEENNSEE